MKHDLTHIVIPRTWKVRPVLADAQKALEDSIAQLKQVTNPSEAFVIQRITGLPNIIASVAIAC
ncbi:MAG: hypothetical protein Q4B45_04055 [Coriobacteriia bacterium]|nr:hypothetical protein [Coriobacteriia bacterium]